MNVDTLKKTLWLLVLTLVQVLILNHVHLFGFATPLLYIYFIILFQRNYPRWALLLWGFALGLLVDIFSNSTGVNCATLTLWLSSSRICFARSFPAIQLITCSPVFGRSERLRSATMHFS